MHSYLRGRARNMVTLEQCLTPVLAASPFLIPPLCFYLYVCTLRGVKINALKGREKSSEMMINTKQQLWEWISYLKLTPTIRTFQPANKMHGVRQMLALLRIQGTMVTSSPLQKANWQVAACISNCFSKYLHMNYTEEKKFPSPW